MAAATVVRALSRQELDLVLDWAAAEGWNPGIEDADCFHAADPEGFFMAYVDGEPAACISAVNYGDRYCFIGCYICRPDRRGQRAGFMVARAGLAHAGTRPAALDGVVDRQDNYRALGFEFAHRNIRYGGTVACLRPDAPRLKDIDEAMLPALIAYDRPLNPAPRERFLRCWLRRTATRRGVAVVEGGRIRGYGVVRACREGFKIGPLFADTPAAAEALFLALAAGTAPAPLFLDPPLPNTAAVGLAERYGMARVFETGRMYRGAVPQIPMERIFGITTFELG
jgi:hypothetical protein